MKLTLFISFILISTCLPVKKNFNKTNLEKLFSKMQISNQKIKIDKEILNLSILTYNTGLLNKKIIFYNFTIPEYKIRSRLLAKEIFKNKQDLYFLQEVWNEKDKDRITKNAKENNYFVFSYVNTNRKHGLMILVKNSILKKVITKKEQYYRSQTFLEKLPLLMHTQKGFLLLKIKLKSLQSPVLLVNTHLSSGYKNWEIRNEQLSELISFINKFKGLVILTGDFNFSPFYPFANYQSQTKQVITNLRANSLSYNLLLNQMNLIDSYIAANTINDYTIWNSVIEKFNKNNLYNEAYGNNKICKNKLLFSNTECNTLNYITYKGEEPPSRFDYIFIRKAKNYKVKILSSKLSFRQPYFTAKKKYDLNHFPRLELSDHYAIESKILIGK